MTANIKSSSILLATFINGKNELDNEKWKNRLMVWKPHTVVQTILLINNS
jgi:hypothetical protein